jgi:hypothetical protein
MSDLFARAMTKGDVFVEASNAVGWMKDVYPFLHQVLAGNHGSNGAVDRHPGSVRLFTNGGELKAEVTGMDWVMRGYLVIPKGFLTVELIEKELAEGRVGWSAKTERKPTY